MSRLRNLDDQESWRTFFDRYWRLLYNVARKSGVDDSGAQEIVLQKHILPLRNIIDKFWTILHPAIEQWKWKLIVSTYRVDDTFR